MKAWGLGNFFSSLAVPVGLQKRLVSFLLQRAIGQFLEDDLDLEKLDIELSNGTVHLTDLKLNTKALNDIAAGTPLAVTQGRIGSITAIIPWRNLWNGQCEIEVDGIDVTLAPTQAHPTSKNDLEDQLLSASMDLANDFLHRTPGKEEAALQESLLQTFQSHTPQAPSGMPGDFNFKPAANPSTQYQPSSTSIPTASSEDDSNSNQPSDGEGVQFVATLIEKLMARIKISCKRTTIRLRHSSSLPLVKTQEALRERLDYELEIRLPYIAYRDETPGWDQPAGSMDASSAGLSSPSQGSDSTSSSTVLEDSVMPSVIWQNSPASIKTIVFKGFSIWIRQQGRKESLVVQHEPTLTSVSDPSTITPSDDQDASDSDTDVFSDAQEIISQSMVASQNVAPRPVSLSMSPPARPATATSQQKILDLYEAEILSTLQHRNRVKVNIRRNATIATGSTLSQAQTTVKSLLDIDFHIKSIFVALSPSQIAFILEILALMDSAPPLDTHDHQKKPTRVANEVEVHRTNPEAGGNPSSYGGRSVTREDPSYHEVQPRMDNSTDRNIPISPKRQQPIESLRQARSPGGRSVDNDRHSEMRNPRVAPQTTTLFLDSSRFLSGSTYGENRSTSSTSSSTSSTPSGLTPSLTVKAKARVSTFQMYVMYQDPESHHNIPTETNFFKNPTPQALKTGHLKLELDSMILRFQKWSSVGAGAGGQKKSCNSQIDFTLNNFNIAEWIHSAPKPFDMSSWSLPSDQYRVSLRKQYIPLVEFDTDQDSLLKTTPTSKFPVLHVPDRYLSERSLLLRSKKNKRQPENAKQTLLSSVESGAAGKDSSSGITKEVVRMRVLLGPKKDSRPGTPSLDSANASSSNGYAQDVTVEVKPMQVHVDLFTFARIEKCLVAIMGSGQKSPVPPIDKAKEQKPLLQRPVEQQIMDDLDGSQKALKAKSRLRLRLNSVQLWVSVPDMALTLAGKEDTGPEYRSIYDIISVNISKLVVTRSSDPAKGAGRPEDHVSKAKVEFASISAFVVPAHETTSRAILYVGSLKSHPSSLSGFNSSVPNFEVTSRLPKSIAVQYEHPSSSDPSQTPGLQAFSILEKEENVLSAVDEEEELLRFKQRTTETSLLVVNAHIPLVAVHLEKRVLDVLQLRINDLSTWSMIFSERLAIPAPSPPVTPVGDNGSRDSPRRQRHESSDTKDDGHGILDDAFRDDRRESLDGGYRDDQSEHGTDQSTAYGEELRNQAEGSPSAPRARVSREPQLQPKVVMPTLASVLLLAQTVEVILDYPAAPTVFDPVPIVKSYQINVSDARVFAGAKYQSGTDTYVSVDAEELEGWEITAHKPKALLLTRTIPKHLKLKSPKPMFHMTSVLSFDPVVKFKENNTNLAFSGISWKFSIDQTAVDDIQDFFAEPAGIVYYDPPHQCTRIRVSLNECCMDYKPLHIPSRFVLTFEKMKVFSTLIPESPTLKSKVQIFNMTLFLIDHIQSSLNPIHPEIGSSASGIESRQFWKSLGYAMVGQCPFFELNSIKSKTGQLPLYDLLITNQIFYLETCSDSFETLTQLAAYLGDNGDMPIEKKKVLERLAEAERAANRAKSNVIYQDILVASLDEDAFRRPNLDQELENAGTLDFTEGFYSVEREDSENDLFKARMGDTPNIDGFHEVYADLLVGSRPGDNSRGNSSGQVQSSKGKSSKQKSKSQPALAAKSGLELDSQIHSLGKSALAKPVRGSTLEDIGRDDRVRSGAHSRKESQQDDIIRVLDTEALFTIVENYFSIPILTEEERAMDEGDFDFSWRLYDGLDWEISRLDEAERKKQARQLANRLYDPNDAIHTTMDSAQSNLEASIFERISGVQPGPIDRHDGQHRKDLSPTSSEADSTCDYQADIMSQASGAGGRPSSTSSSSRRSGHQYQQQHSSSHHQDPNKRKKKLERSKGAMIEFNAEKVRIDFEDYTPGIEKASHLSLRVRQFEIIDNLKSSLWRKFLSHQRQDSHMATPRLTQSNMIRVDLDGVRPVVTASIVEYRLKVKILPLRLYVDQDALVFLIKFFVQSASGKESVSGEDLMPEGMTTVPDGGEKKKPNELYFQSVKLGEISVKVDYKPKHVDYTGLTGGNFVELMNFFHLDAAEMALQEVRLHGINGVAKLSQDLVAAWLPHIRSTQVPHMVSGLTPIRSLVNLGSGIADLVLLPIEQYKRDGHIIRGLQKGGQAFTRATTLEALKIGTRLAVGTQVLLEHADEIFGSAKATGASTSKAAGSTSKEDEDDSDVYGGKRVVATMVSDSEAYMQESIDGEDQLLQHLYYQQQQQQQQQYQLSSDGASSSSSSASTSKGHKVSKYANQPADINEGMELAYKSLSKNIGAAAHTIFAVPMEVYEQTGAQGSVRAVIRAVPVAVLKPMIGATEAFSKVLIGIRNSIDPEQRLQMEDKYKNQ
ncbi:autophagy- protein 2 [Mortierella sp. AD094]|nr:autophagy- protein 2 [Mortierella sp. AD094]